MKTIVKKFQSYFEKSRVDSLEFLPAALEVTETPPAPLGRIIIWVIIAFFLIAVIWAILGKVDIVAVAQGKIVPSGRVKVIQPLETGVVKAIHVEEGQQVEKGQVLIELDSTISDADKERLQNEYTSLQLDVVRLKKLLDNIGLLKSSMQGDSTEYHLLSTEHSQLIPATASDHQIELLKKRIHSQFSEFLSRQAALKDQVREQQAELKAVEERIAQLNATIPLVTERTSAMQKMLDSGVVPRATWLEVEEQRINQVKERDIQKSNRERLQAAVASAQQQSNALQSQVEGQWLAELNETETRLQSISQEVVKAEQRQTLQALSAPVAGTVQQLSIHTIGGVVTPAQELMLLVPDAGAIEVEAWVQNKDIGFVAEDQEAEIKVETFAYTKYGVIDGEILNVSNDAVPNEKLGLIYVARVKMDKSTMVVNGKTVNLSPGMAVTVEVKTGKRRIIEYIASPLLRYKEESVKER